MASVKVEEANVLKLLENEPEGLEKILCIGDQGLLTKTAEELRLCYSDRLHFTSSKPHFFDMIHKDVNKGTALKALADQWDIRQAEVMAIGDSLNDKEMIAYAGIGVAMENAIRKSRRSRIISQLPTARWRGQSHREIHLSSSKACRHNQ
jgi:hydroxymethylpyrimidine pyrophosphatase-like HAD family hydrolase